MFYKESNKICIRKLSSEDRRPGVGIYKRKQENDQHKQKVFRFKVSILLSTTLMIVSAICRFDQIEYTGCSLNIVFFRRF